jgi:methionine-rich copper-binding protein CopC
MFRRILLSCLLVLFSVASAYAHAHVKSSMPKAGEVMTIAPKAVTITFSEALRPAESTITVYDGKGKAINDGKVTSVSAGNDSISAPLPTPLAAGNYTVKWKAVCLCTDHHATKGGFKFSVK